MHVPRTYRDEQREWEDILNFANLTSGELPAWVDRARSAITDSAEWRGLKQLVFERVKAGLASSHLTSFSELTDEEKLVFIKRVEMDMAGEDSYRAVSYRVSKAVNEHLSRDVDQVLCRRDVNMSKRDIIIHNASLSLVHLMQKWKDQHHHVAMLTNQRLVNPLRAQVWRLRLTDVASEREYAVRVADHRLETIADSDESITRRCQEMIASEFPSLEVSLPQLTAMKTVISYHASRQAGVLDENIYYHVVPLVVVFPQECVQMSPLVGFLSSFLAIDRPHFVDASDRKAERKASHQFAARIASLLKAEDPELHGRLISILAPDSERLRTDRDRRDRDRGRDRDRDRDRHKSSSASTPRSDAESIASLLGDAIERVFVGVTSIETTLYIWDTCLMAGFEVLHQFSVIMLILLRKALVLCTSAKACRRVVQGQASMLHFSQFQREMEKRFMPELRRRLQIPSREELDTAIFQAPAFVSHPHFEVSDAPNHGFWDTHHATAGAAALSHHHHHHHLQQGPNMRVHRGATDTTTGGPSTMSRSEFSDDHSITHEDASTELSTSGYMLRKRKRTSGVSDARLRFCMMRWRIVAWYAGIWALYLNSHRTALERGKEEPKQCRVLACVSGTRSIRAGSPIMIPSKLVHFQNNRFKIRYPPVFPNIDRFMDTLERIKTLPSNSGLFPIIPAELQEFLVQVEDHLFYFLPFLHDDSEEQVLRIEVPREGGTQPIYLSPLVPQKPRQQARAVVLRNVLDLPLIPKVTNALKSFMDSIGIDYYASSMADDPPDRRFSLQAPSAQRELSSIDLSADDPADEHNDAVLTHRAEEEAGAAAAAAGAEFEYEYDYEYDDPPSLHPALALGEIRTPQTGPDVTNLTPRQNNVIHHAESLPDLFRNVVHAAMQGISLVAFGDERERDELVQIMREKQAERTQYKHDLEVAAFGKPLSPQEITKMGNADLIAYRKQVVERMREHESEIHDQEAKERAILRNQ